MVARRYSLNEGHGCAKGARAYDWTSVNIVFELMERRTRFAWKTIVQEETGYRTAFMI